VLEAEGEYPPAKDASPPNIAPMNIWETKPANPISRARLATTRATMARPFSCFVAVAGGCQ
jgi:hypothetical protein